MKNPFVFGTVVDNENFTDRKKEIEGMVLDLQSRTNLVVFSPRRYGKTSLIFRVMDRLREIGVVCAYADLYSVTSKAKFVDVLASSVARSGAGKIDEMIRSIKEAIPPIKMTIRPEADPDMSGIEIEVSKAGDADYNLAKMFDLPAKIARKKRKRMVVVFDEFQEVSRINGGEIEKMLRSKIQVHKDVSYVFVGSQMRLLGKMFNKNDRALYRAAKPFSLKEIPREEFGRFIKDRFKSGRISILGEISDLVLDATRCHPYYTQQLCHEIWNVCVSEGAKKVSENHVKTSIESVIENQGHAYTVMWEHASGRQRELLMALSVSDGDGIFSSKVREKYELGPPSSVARAMQGLEEGGMVERRDGRHVIPDAFFQEWVRRIC